MSDIVTFFGLHFGAQLFNMYNQRKMEWTSVCVADRLWQWMKEKVTQWSERCSRNKWQITEQHFVDSDLQMMSAKYAFHNAKTMGAITGSSW